MTPGGVLLPPFGAFRKIRKFAPVVALAWALIASLTPDLRAQESSDSLPASQSRASYWKKFGAGFASSILAHEAAHVATSLALGKRPTFALSKGRPTVYSGIVLADEPHAQFLFSSMGLNVQAALDESVLDVPHQRGGAYERGILAGGIATALFYVTIGRTASVSDVDVMARTGTLTKNQVTLLYGGVALLHTVRIARDGHYANFFLRPGVERGMKVGVRVE